MQLFETVEALRPLGPAYVSVTYGAGGSTRARTLEIVKRLKRETEVEAMAHITCVGASRDEIAAVLDEIAEAGDPERARAAGRSAARRDRASRRTRTASATRASSSRSSARAPSAGASASAPPRTRRATSRRATSRATSRNLKTKVDAGADFLVTQLFFENAHYLRFVERARAAGIAVPILPGIMPFTNVDQVERFTAMCGACIPPLLRAAMEVRRADRDAARDLGVAYATLQCADLLRRGAPGIHFYTLNRSPSTRAILAALRASEPWRG